MAPCAAEVDVHNLLVMGLEHLEYTAGVSKTHVVVWNGKAGKTMSTTNAGWLQRAIVRDCTAEEITVLEQAAENTTKRGAQDSIGTYSRESRRAVSVAQEL